MSNTTKLILENVVSGGIDKDLGIKLLKTLKSESGKIHKDIAIIGMAGRFPMADNIKEYWLNLRNGHDCISAFPKSRSEDIEDFLACYMETEANKIEYPVGGYLRDIDKFDYSFFKISPKEASLIDPHQRLFLETAWNALEDAGYAGDCLYGTNTGVYIGYINWPFYMQMIAKAEPCMSGMSTAGNVPSITASRISYFLNLKGPSIAVDTACSSSLVAVHLACKAIINGECDQTIAGGVRIRLMNTKDNEGIGIVSKDSRAKAFDESADGTGWGEGVAAILLKPLSKAIEDGDTIHAVIKGSAVNQDGESMDILAPNAMAQEEVILKAWNDSGIDPLTISYIEAHGTGTKLGDPIEISGIQRAFHRYTNRKQFCAIGSVKPNIGHLDSASGIVGLIKTVMAIKNKEIPPSINIQLPNKKIEFEKSPVYLNRKLRKWEVEGMPRRCGVSSFGFSGTNCHIILEEKPSPSHVAVTDKTNIEKVRDYHILTISAKSEYSLMRLITNYEEFLIREYDLDINDICYTAAIGKGHYSYRIAIMFKDIQDLKMKLKRLRKNCKSDEENLIYYGFSKTAPVKKDDKISDFLKEDILSTNELSRICKMYINGACVDWKRFYLNEKRKRVNLPLYPFEKNRCWVNVKNIKQMVRKQEKDQMFFKMDWEQENLNESRRKQFDGCILIFKDADENIGSLFGEQFRTEGQDVIEIVSGSEFRQISENKYVVSAQKSDYGKLFRSLMSKKIGCIIHLQSLRNKTEIISSTELEESQKQGLFSFFYIIKCLLDSGIEQEPKVIVISSLISEVTGTEEGIHPENATIFGLGKVIASENPRLGIKFIDVDEHTDLKNIFIEAVSITDTTHCAYRDNKRYVEKLILLRNDLEQRIIELKSDGVYLIAGGMGGIGLEVSKHLAARNRIKIALLGRSEFPGRSEWERIIREDTDIKLCTKINALREIEKMGSEVDYYNVDITKEEEMEALLKLLRSKHSRINGVIHSAGIAGDGFIIRKEENTLRTVISPKVKGTWLLDKLTREDNPDFFVMFSSTATLLNTPGQGDYIAANAYFDSFAAYRAKRGGRTLTINWTTWNQIGMAADFNIKPKGVFSALTVEQALAGFDKAIAGNESRVIIGNMNLQSEAFLSEEGFAIHLSDEIKNLIEEKRKEQHVGSRTKPNQETQQVKIKEAGIHAVTKTELTIAQIWYELLGIPEMSLNDNFFELGGNSISALRFEVELEKRNLKMNQQDIYLYPEVSALARYLDKKAGGLEGIEERTEESPSSEKNCPKKEVNLSTSELIERIEPFNDIFYKNCFYNSLFPIIKHYGKSTEIIILNDVITYNFDEAKNELKFSIDYIPCADMKQIFDKLGLEVKQKTVSQNILDDIKESIKNQMPVIIRVDSYYESIRADTYHEKHFDHSLLIYGYDDSKEQCHIIEHKHADNLSYEKTSIAYQEIIDSYNGYLEHFLAQNNSDTFYSFHPNEFKCNIEQETKKEQAAEYICNLFEKKDAIYKGLEHLDNYFQYFNERFFKGAFSEEVFSHSLDELNNIINGKTAQHYITCYLFGDFCEMSDRLKCILNDWKYIRRLIAKSLFSLSYDMKIHNLISEKLKSIYEAEIKLIEAQYQLK